MLCSLELHHQSLDLRLQLMLFITQQASLPCGGLLQHVDSDSGVQVRTQAISPACWGPAGAEAVALTKSTGPLGATRSPVQASSMQQAQAQDDSTALEVFQSTAVIMPPAPPPGATLQDAVCMQACARQHA